MGGCQSRCPLDSLTWNKEHSRALHVFYFNCCGHRLYLAKLPQQNKTTKTKTDEEPHCPRGVLKEGLRWPRLGYFHTLTFLQFFYDQWNKVQFRWMIPLLINLILHWPYSHSSFLTYIVSHKTPYNSLYKQTYFNENFKNPRCHKLSHTLASTYTPVNEIFYLPPPGVCGLGLIQIALTS